MPVGREAENWGMKEIPHKHAFSPEELRTIDAAFRSAWTVLHVSGPYEKWSDKEGLKLALRKKMFAFACHGVTGREALTTITLRNFGL